MKKVEAISQKYVISITNKIEEKRKKDATNSDL
jgi:hypothetical protein